MREDHTMSRSTERSERTFVRYDDDGSRINRKKNGTY